LGLTPSFRWFETNPKSVKIRIGDFGFWIVGFGFPAQRPDLPQGGEVGAVVFEFLVGPERRGR